MQFVRFALVGVTNTAVTLIAYALGLRLGVAYIPAGACAYALGATNGYALNRTWTFRAHGRAARYFAVVAVGLAANALLLRGVVAAGVPRLAAQALATGPVTLLTFALCRTWAFAEQDASPPYPSVPGLRRAVRRLRRRAAGLRPRRSAAARLR
ncbi:MAG TPA: GtrA family protein [Solirubrobacter sp.]|nr:GtrA family protein [Solirubrobacter sp.]